MAQTEIDPNRNELATDEGEDRLPAEATPAGVDSERGTMSTDSSKHGAFPQTVTRFVRGGAEGKPAAIGELYVMYKSPLRAMLQYRMGLSYTTAEGFVQDFFADKVMINNCIPAYKREDGKFRTFLLVALINYVKDQFKKQNAGKRKPTGGFVPMDHPDVPEIADSRAAVVIEDHEFSRAVVAESLRRVREHYESHGKAHYWELYECRVLAPLSDGSESARENAARVQRKFRSPIDAHQSLGLVKRKVDSALHEVVLEYVKDEARVDDEIEKLKASLRGGRH